MTLRLAGPTWPRPVPYGHYAKDYVDEMHKCLGCAACQLHGLMGGGGHGHALFHKGEGGWVVTEWLRPWCRLRSRCRLR